MYVLIIYVCTYICMYLYMYVFIYVFIYLCMYLFMYVMYVGTSQQHICMQGHEMKQSIDQPVLSILVVVSCVYRRAYICTCTRRVQTTTYPGHTHTDQPRHKRMYTHAELRRYSSTRANSSPRVHYVRRSCCSCQILYGYKYSVRAQARGPTNDRCIAQAVHAKYCTGTSTACEPKHAGVRTIGASPRLSMPNTVRVLVQRVSPSTQAYAQSVHRSGGPCQILYGYKYSVRAQARGPTHDRCIAQVVYAKYCTCTSTACEPKHAGLRTIGASPRLSIP